MYSIKLRDLLHSEGYQNIAYTSVHSGAIVSDLFRGLTPTMRKLMSSTMMSTEYGARTYTYLALVDTNTITGNYYVNCKTRKYPSEVDKVTLREMV